MKRLRALLLLVLAATAPARAEELIMVRTDRPFPEAMNNLQQIIRDRGYHVARIQRIDVGLASSGYKTAEYRVVFLAKPAEIETLAARHPELLPYLPLKITIYAEADSTLALTNNPLLFGQFFPLPELKPHFERWERDVRAILEAFARDS